MYDKDLVSEICRQILTATDKIIYRFKPVKSVSYFTNTNEGMEKLDSICMLIIAIGESLKNIDKITNGKLLAQYPEINWKGAKIHGFNTFDYYEYAANTKKQINEIKSLCTRLKIKKLYVFGSVVSNKFKENSDIDFLISFSDKLSIDEYTRNYFTLHYQLRELFNRETDIITERTLSNPYLIESIDETKKLIYEA